MSAIDRVRLIVARERIHVFWRELKTEWCYAADFPEYQKYGYEIIAVDPDDRVLWDVHKDLAAALLRQKT